MSKILVTGALGTVGTYLVQKLKLAGHDVWMLDLSHHHDPQYFRADIGRYKQLEQIFDKHRFDYVYNLAAEFGRWNGEDYYETLWTTNAIGLKNLIRLQEQHKFRMVHASSSEVYGDYDGVMSEEVMEKHEIRQMNDYAITKWVNEMQILNSAEMFNTETVRIRIFNTYGPGEHFSDYRSVVCRFVYCALNDMPYTVHRGHTRTHTYIEDSATWISRICDNFKPGQVYNIAGTERTDIETISNEILHAIGKNDSKVTYKDAEPMTTIDKVVDASRQLADLGELEETPFHVGIERTVKWMRDTYGIKS